MTIRSILDRNRREVITIRATETVKSAADRMREHSIAALVAVMQSSASYQSARSYTPSRGMGREHSPWRLRIS
jgi:hypothetical protein